MNYNEEMKKILKENKDAKVLLHSCCGPCSTSVIERLYLKTDLTVVFYNPNIEPVEEYNLRKKEQIKILDEYNIKYIDSDYENNLFREKIKGLEEEPERGLRCTICFSLRLNKVADIAIKNNFDFFATTLTLSPYKNAKLINELGLTISKTKNIPFLVSDFKKEEGYKRSIELSKKYNIYRQDYCGCLFSKRGNYE